MSKCPTCTIATYTRCPRRGGVALSFNEAEIKALPGVTDAFIVAPDDRAGKASMSFMDGLAVLRGGVAIVGEDTWSVMDAKSKLQVRWDESKASTDSWRDMVAQAKAHARDGDGEVRLEGRGVDAALASADHRTLEAFYQFPYVAHICMEPMNCTAHYRRGDGGEPDTLEIWFGSQFPDFGERDCEEPASIWKASA